MQGGVGLRVQGVGCRVSSPGKGGASYEAPGQLGQDEPASYRAVEPSSGSNVIPRRARPGLAGLVPHPSRAQGSGCRVSALDTSESGPLRAVQLSRHKWPGRLAD